jgi:hypothetical protein
MHRFRLLSALVAGFLVLALLLCGLLVWKAQMALLEKKAEVATLERKAHAPVLANQAPPAAPQKPLTEVVVADHLPPATAGPALGVSDPVANNATPDTAAFGAGCTRWLQFAMWNYPQQLGQMPPWSVQERARQELGTPNLRLTAAQAEPFARMGGYTHVVFSTITGTPAHCTLVLQVLVLPGKIAKGPACTASGSEAQVIAALPNLAQQLLTRINIQTPALATPTLTGEDLRHIGNYAWWSDGKVPAEEQQQLQALALREPLAGMLYMMHTPQSVQVGQAGYRRLFAQAPTNLEARAECLKIWRYLSPDMQRDVAKDLPDLPANYVVATWQLVSNRLPQEAVQRAEHLVQVAPRDPAAWTTLAQQYADVAGHLRNGRNAAEITPAEWTALNRLYAHQLMAAQQAASLDPDLGLAWYDVAVAATFAGHPPVADAALWKAIRLSNGSARAYLWGLEMYQPKWLGDAAKLDKVVKLAVADHALNSQGQYALAAALQKLGRVTEAQVIEAQAKAGNQAGR